MICFSRAAPQWRQILADVFETELVTVNTTEGAAYGAAVLAGVGTAHWQNVESACDSVVRVTGRTVPTEENARAYRAVYDLYSEMYPLLKSSFVSMNVLESA